MNSAVYSKCSEDIAL